MKRDDIKAIIDVNLVRIMREYCDATNQDMKVVPPYYMKMLKTIRTNIADMIETMYEEPTSNYQDEE